MTGSGPLSVSPVEPSCSRPATLAYALHTIQPLPFSNRFIPAAVGLTLGVALLTPATKTANRSSTSTHQLAGVVAAMAAASLVVPLLVAMTWPAPSRVIVGSRPLRVMTFNIDQGVTLGQLHLERIAQIVDTAHPDVVVIEEVGADGRSRA